MGRRSRPFSTTPPSPSASSLFPHTRTDDPYNNSDDTHQHQQEEELQSSPLLFQQQQQQDLHRQHQAYKALPKSTRQRLIATDAALLARTVHLRFLPTSMRQGDLAALCGECGRYTRVRLCGSSAVLNNNNNSGGGGQHWVYGFVEFAERRGAVEMLRRSGTELPNGAGRPPLRLKCTAAKQAIVDRVFHDADEAAGIACIFGTGNFAHRTLKEAVDSYHNLKRKEGNGNNGIGGARSNSSGSQQPVNNSSHSNNTNGSRYHHIPAPRHRMEKMSEMGSIHELHPTQEKQGGGKEEGYEIHEHNNNNNHNLHHTYTYTHSYHYQERASLSPSVPLQLPLVQQHLQQQQQQQQQQHYMGYHSISGSNSDNESAGITPLMHVSGPNTNPALNIESARNITPIFFNQSTAQTHVVGNSNRETYSDDIFSLHDEHTSPPLKLSYTALSVGVNGFSLSPSSSSSTAAASTASQMYLLDRARALVLTVMRCAQRYIATGEQLYDAIGALRTLLALVDQQVDKMGGVLDASMVTHIEEVEQKQQFIQLRLVTHLLTCMLYAYKGNIEEALSAIHSVVTCCNMIPCTRLHLPTLSSSLLPSSPLLTSPHILKRKEQGIHQDKVNDIGMRDATISVVGNNTLESNFTQDSAAMEGSRCDEDVSCTFNPLLQTFDFLSVVNMNDEDEQEAAVLNAAMGILPTDDQEDTNDNVQNREEQQLLQEQIYQCNVQLHTYVLNVLFTIALAMETTHPVVARCVYVLIVRRAKEVFGVALQQLEEMLLEGGVHHLREMLFPQLNDRKFLAVFFDAFDVSAAVGDVFWRVLPPHHMIQLFQPAGGM
ncbi:hypothetical protein LSM04_001769 [Trypanosoma melophagium]|uniref:uncharacterized protein n=1 Tax=Trypanosoma melophagium TaxID=715481 RepID=UPI00351A93DF|nr:hypothetical protein LSM04_001769 [Trypanosoma melophagium]